MIVNHIEPLDKRRCKVFIDENFAFALYKGELHKYKIEEGMELPESDYKEILEQVIFRRARERALYLLKFSGRTEVELRRKLRTGYYPDQAVDAAVDFLKEYGYINDSGYAENYIEVYGKRKSKAELKGALLQKGVDKNLVEKLLSEQCPDEEEQVRSLLCKRKFSESDAPEQKRKNIAFLMRRGYSYDTIRHVMGRIEEDGFD